MGKAQGRMLREADEQVIAAEALYSWDSLEGIKARKLSGLRSSPYFTERETEA